MKLRPSFMATQQVVRGAVGTISKVLQYPMHRRRVLFSPGGGGGGAGYIYRYRYVG